MAVAFQQNIRQLGRRLRSGPFGQFLRWWWNELLLAMPVRWRERLQKAMRRVTLMLEGGTLEVYVDENRSLRKLDVLKKTQDHLLQRQELDDLLNRNSLAEAPRFLLLDRGCALTKHLKLPLAAEPNLRQVLSFEMDRQTPFRASDVYFDWNIVDRNSETGQLGLELFVVPRVELDTAYRAASERGLLLNGIDIRDGGRSLGLNLLPEDQRNRSANPKLRWNLALGGAALLLMVLVMWQSLALRQHQIAELEQAIADVQGEARRVSATKRQIEDASEAAGFLALRRTESPLSIEILTEVTRLLPDDTYLDRLVVSGRNVQMQGKSENAQQLIERVNGSELFKNAAFRGSTRLDARSGREIFEVNAKIVRRGTD
jgi:general secretion pathway protein L